MLLEFSAGPVGSPTLRAAAGAIIAALALIALTDRSFRAWIRGGILLSWIVLPTLLGLGVHSVMPFFYPRFLMFVTPALALIAAHGIQTVMGSKLGPRRLVALTITGAFAALAGLLFTAQSWQSDALPDLRPVAERLDTQLKGEDALIYSYSWQPGMLAAYLPDARQPVYYPSFFEDAKMEGSLADILEEHGRVWLLTYIIGADNPINDVGLYLLEHAATPGGVWYGESQLTLFLSEGEAANLEGVERCSDFAGGRITLCAVPLDATMAHGEPLVLKLAWQASAPIDQRYVVFVHLLAEGNPIPAAQQDVQPVNGLRPTYTWTPGEQIDDLHAVVLPAQEDVYRIAVGLYDADTLARVLVDGRGDSVDLGEVTVVER
jgi:hypothetical protein